VSPLSPDPDFRPYAADRPVAPAREDGLDRPGRERWPSDAGPPGWRDEPPDWPAERPERDSGPGRERGALGGWLWALRRHIAAIVVGILLGGAVAFLFSLTQETLYASQSDIVVSPSTKFLDPTDSDAFPAWTTTVQALTLTRSVLADATGRLAQVGQGGLTPGQLNRRIRLSVLGDTPILELQARAATQERANATAAALTGAVETAINTPPPGSQSVPPGIVVRVFSRAVPQGKVQPRTTRNIVLGANAGLVIALLLAVALFPLERPRRRPADESLADAGPAGPGDIRAASPRTRP
jgi:capsular polysaccharide biosynthesis protein